MEMVLMGTGTSFGVPVAGCSCSVCTSSDSRNRRNRCSAWVRSPASIVIDTSPEFRLQAVKHRITHVDAVLITHSHADHLHGLDDLRIYSHTKAVEPDNPLSACETEGEGMPIYCNSNTLEDIKFRFAYIFAPVKEGGGKPKLCLKDVACYKKESPLEIEGIQVLSIPIMHGSLKDSGWLLSQNVNGSKHSIAYLTDCNYISDESLNLVRESAGSLDHLVIDALRQKKHSTHFCFDEALEVAQKLGARHTWFTHLTHDLSHNQVQEYIDLNLFKYPDLMAIVEDGGSVSPAWDGVVLKTL